MVRTKDYINRNDKNNILFLNDWFSKSKEINIKIHIPEKKERLPRNSKKTIKQKIIEGNGTFKKWISTHDNTFFVILYALFNFI